MKRNFLSIVFSLFCAVALVSCGGNKKRAEMPNLVNVSVSRLDSVAEFHTVLMDTPSQVAVALFNAITAGDVETVMTNIHFPNELEGETFREYLVMAVSSEDFATRTSGYTANYTPVSEQINGDTAYVELVGTTVLDRQTRFKVLLTMVDGWWKVDGPYSVLHSQLPSSVEE